MSTDARSNPVDEVECPICSDFEEEDSDDVDLIGFEMVSDFWIENQASEQETTVDAQTDNSPELQHNVNDVTDDVINRNVSLSSTQSETSQQLDNEAVMISPTEQQENEPADDVVEVRALKMVEASVGAVTLLNDELFVALNGLHQIHVFHIDDLQFIRCLQVNGLGAQVYGLAASSVSERLYISDWDNDLLHSLPLNHDDDEEDDDPTSWEVANQPAGLSLTLAGQPNVLVACHGAGKIQEWSPEGILIREIQLADVSKLVWHVLPLTDEKLLVSHEGSQHRVVTVSAEDGHELRSCAQVDGVQLQYPRCMVVNRDDGRVLVADQCNNRIITVDQDLEDPRQLQVNLNEGLAWPYGLHLDPDRRRLYVTEWNQGRIMRLDLP